LQIAIGRNAAMELILTGEPFSAERAHELGLVNRLVEPGQAVLTQANGETIRSSDPEALVERMIGRRVPVREMRIWLRSPLPTSPSMQQVKRDEQGRIISFAQGGWGVELSRFDAQGPRLLVLSRTQGSKHVVVRLVVDAP
jgi:outer membrane lipoprotein LolB